MPSLADFDLPTLARTFNDWGHKPSHAARLLRHFFARHGEVNWAELEVGAALAQRVGAELPPLGSSVTRRTVAADGTTKLLVTLADGAAVEAVLMPGYRKDRAAGCVSSQVGCAMRCDFASTRNGVKRNLSAGEIVEQFLHLRRESAALGRRLGTVVFMGMGEPMLNLDAVTGAIERMTDPRLGQLGQRHLTVSTVGIVPGIERLAKSALGVHLAVSLHAPDDELRAKLVPVNQRWGIEEVLAATADYQRVTGRVPTIEYCLLAGVNDSIGQAEKLGRLLAGFEGKGLHAHVNLIPYNAIGVGLSGVIYERPEPEAIQSFLKTLREAGVVAHVRHTRGDDVSAACGQLATESAHREPVA